MQKVTCCSPNMSLSMVAPPRLLVIAPIRSTQSRPHRIICSDEVSAVFRSASNELPAVNQPAVPWVCRAIRGLQALDLSYVKSSIRTRWTVLQPRGPSVVDTRHPTLHRMTCRLSHDPSAHEVDRGSWACPASGYSSRTSLDHGVAKISASRSPGVELQVGGNGTWA